MHLDASNKQQRAVISYNGKPLIFYSRKLCSTQRNDTTTEQELLHIVETLRDFGNILLGQIIKVYADHKNLMYKLKFISSIWVICRRHLIEEVD